MSDDNQTDNEFIIECLTDVKKPFIYILNDIDSNLLGDIKKIDLEKMVCINPKENEYKNKYLTKDDLETKCLLYALIDGTNLSANVVIIDTYGVLSYQDVKDLWEILGISMVVFKNEGNLIIYD